MIVLGISGGFGHDAAACLVRDGRVVAMAEEERLSRARHAPSALPILSTLHCLAEASVPAGAVDCVVASWDPDLDPGAVELEQRLASFLAHPALGGHRPRRVERVDHHLAHAAASYLTSGFDRAAVLVIDGNGERWATSVGGASAGAIRWHERHGVTHSLGHFYTAVAEWLGFDAHEEGKLMGLAGYGRAELAVPALRVVDEGVEVSLPSVDHLGADERYRALREQWLTVLAGAFGEPRRAHRRWDRGAGRVVRELPYGPFERDVAASAQAATTDAVCALARRAVRLSGSRDLVLAGGVALNCSANGAVLERGIADRVHVFPAAGDAGGALGAALLIAAAEGALAPPTTPFLGPSYEDEAIVREFRRVGLPFEECDPAARGAELLARGRIVAWFEGPAEVGPRALGARSLLADPGDIRTRDHVNSVKGREPWRPLSPSILSEWGPELVGAHSSPHMLLALRASERMRELMPAVVHVDGTTRPQTVAPGASSNTYRRLLERMNELTGRPGVLNTSLNVAGEPIVSSPGDAVRTFCGSGVDALIAGSFVAVKRGVG